MPSKFELASYLVSLHTLMEAQSKGQTSIPSTELANEYNKCWSEMKEIIMKENEDDSRQSRSLERGERKTGADLPRDQSRSGGSVGSSYGLSEGPIGRR